MESYIEVTWIHNVLIGLIAYYGSSFFSFSKVRMPHFFAFLVGELLFVVLCYEEVFKSIFYLYELGMYFVLFHHHYKRLFMYISIKYALSFTFFKLLGGSFHLLHYFVPIWVNPLGLWLIMALLVFSLRQKWSVYLKVSDFIYHIEILGKTTLRVKGYLDTGNTLLHKGRPVLFLDKRYCPSIQQPQKEEWIEMQTLHAKENIKAYLYDVKIERYKTQPCYISCDKDVTLEWGCVCLLNMEM